MSFEVELPGKPSSHWSGQQHMFGLFHHKPRCRDGMDKAFEGGDRACSKTGPFHQRGVHPLDPIQLPFRTTAGIEQPGVFKHADGAFDCEQG